MEEISPNVYRVQSLDSFLTFLKSHPADDDEIRLFRGHRDPSWKIESLLSREVDKTKQEQDYYRIEKELFHRYKSKLELINKNKCSDWEVISLAQHYGLPTKIIDWTENPLIGLWFAFSSKAHDKNDRVLLSIRIRQWDIVDFDKEHVFEGRFPRFFKPQNFFSDSRIRNQEAWFSTHPRNIILTQHIRSGDGLPRFDKTKTMDENPYFNIRVTRLLFEDRLRTSILRKLKSIIYQG